MSRKRVDRRRGAVDLDVKDPAAASEALERTVKIFERVGDSRRRAMTVWRLGTAHHLQGERAAAREAWRSALEIIQAMGVIDAADVEAIMAADVPECPAALRDA